MASSATARSGRVSDYRIAALGSTAVDAVALAGVIVAGVGAASTGINAFYNTRRTAKAAQEGRAEQRAADGYLMILSLAEQEAQWFDSIVFNLGLDRKELEYGVSEMKRVPKPEVTDRATAAALVSAFTSNAVDTSHAAWREAADALDTRIEGISWQMTEDGDPTANVPEEWMKELTDVLQPKEHKSRKALAEAVAHELGHRRQRPPTPPVIWGPP
jgi:hypothetical protein